MAKQKGTGPKMRFVDLPEVGETFADSIHGLYFDGITLRLIFTVTRWDDPKPPTPPTGKQYPACRLVLTAQGAQDLYNQLNQVAAAIEQSRKNEQSPTMQ